MQSGANRRRYLMIHLNKDCHAFQLLSVLAVVGEYPLRSIDLLGNKRMYRATIDAMTKKQVYINDYTKERTDEIRVVSIVGKGYSRSVRLLSSAKILLEWTGLYEYYYNAYCQSNFPGGKAHKDRNFKIAETLAMCRLAGIEYNPSHLPSLVYRERAISCSYQYKDNLPTVPAFYHVRDLKGDKNYEMKKVVFTRLTGALFVEKSCFTFYNLGKEIVNLWENAEVKMKDVIETLNIVNGGKYAAFKTIFFGTDIMNAVKTLRYLYNKRTNKHKDYTGSQFYSKVYFLPLSKEGARYFRAFTVKDWETKILKALYPKDHDWGNEYWHNTEKAYYYSFLDFDIAGLLYVKKKIKETPFPYVIVCYKHQEDFVKKIFSKKIRTLIVDFERVEHVLGLTKEEGDENENQEQTGCDESGS